MPKDWTPPYPSWSANFDPSLEKVVIAYIGVPMQADSVVPFHEWLQSILHLGHAPANVERASCVDVSGYRNDVYICYWSDENTCRLWLESSEFVNWWQDKAHIDEEVGYWREVIFAPKNRFETLFSSEDRAGMAKLAPRFGGEIKEHGYWGGMRDRIRDSDIDDFESPYGSELLPLAKVESQGRRVLITPPENLCLIRSAQNWTACQSEELAIYKNDVHPVLIEGMNYIRDNPIETGCISCRFMDELSLTGKAQTKTFGLAFFLTMEHLEAWAKSHPSHLAIFQSFHKMVTKLNFQLALKLWHEVIVLPAGEHIFEYVNCHPQTGLLPYFEAD